jgi:ferredoxin-NADP reductase
MEFKKAVLKKHSQLTHNVFQLDLEIDEPSAHLAGQFITIRINNGGDKPTMRAYSLANKPGDNLLQLCVKAIEGGSGSTWLNEIKEGEEIEYIGPAGGFTFAPPATEDTQKEILLIATGTGIAPIKAMLEDELTNKNSQQKFNLIFGVRHIKDVFYKELLEQLAQDYPNFTYQITLSKPEDPSWEQEGGLQGRVTDYLHTLNLNPTNTESYACGLKPMIEETTALLQEKGLPKEAIHHENFG